MLLRAVELLGVLGGLAIVVGTLLYRGNRKRRAKEMERLHKAVAKMNEAVVKPGFQVPY